MRVQLDGHLHCDYLDVLRLPVLTKTIKKSTRIIKASGLKFDSIAFCGMSGSLVAPALAVALKKKLIMVRKTTDKSHSSCCVEGYIEAKKYLFVDDFISSGETFKFARKQIKNEFTAGDPAKCVGIFEYRDFTLYQYTFRGKPLNQEEKPQSSESDSVGTVPAELSVAVLRTCVEQLKGASIKSSRYAVTAPVSDDGDDIPF